MFHLPSFVHVFSLLYSFFKPPCHISLSPRLPPPTVFFFKSPCSSRPNSDLSTLSLSESLLREDPSRVKTHFNAFFTESFCAVMCANAQHPPSASPQCFFYCRRLVSLQSSLLWLHHVTLSHTSCCSLYFLAFFPFLNAALNPQIYYNHSNHYY